MNIKEFLDATKDKPEIQIYAKRDCKTKNTNGFSIPFWGDENTKSTKSAIQNKQKLILVNGPESTLHNILNFLPENDSIFPDIKIYNGDLVKGSIKRLYVGFLGEFFYAQYGDTNKRTIDPIVGYDLRKIRISCARKLTNKVFVENPDSYDPKITAKSQDNLLELKNSNDFIFEKGDLKSFLSYCQVNELPPMTNGNIIVQGGEIILQQSVVLADMFPLQEQLLLLLESLYLGQKATSTLLSFRTDASVDFENTAWNISTFIPGVKKENFVVEIENIQDLINEINNVRTSLGFEVLNRIQYTTDIDKYIESKKKEYVESESNSKKRKK